MKNIEKLCAETGFRFEKDGEVGFGRKCVGIIDDDTNCFVAYAISDKDLNLIAELSVPVAYDAYHKSPCLCVLSSSISVEEATDQLDEWCGRILEKGYKIQTYQQTGSAVNFFSGKSSVTMKAIVDK